MAEPLKQVYNRAFMSRLSAAIAAVFPAFDSQLFQQKVFDAQWPARELKSRMSHIACVLGDCLPAIGGGDVSKFENKSAIFLKTEDLSTGFLMIF